jgi:hypothetical protein
MRGDFFASLCMSRCTPSTANFGALVNAAIKDRNKASGEVGARRSFEAPGNLLAELASQVAGDSWATTELKHKLESFYGDHPRLYRLLEQKLTELH